MNDHLALLVGRAILAFGRIDQEVWNAIRTFHSFQRMYHVRLNPHKHPPKSPSIDKRFAYRLTQLRGLIERSPTETPLTSRFDEWRTCLDDLERQRAHLAHGTIIEIGGDFHVYDAREDQTFLDAINKAFDNAARIARRTGKDHLARKPIEEAWRRHTGIVYSTADLQRLETQLGEAWQELRALTEVALASWQQNLPPLQH